MMRQRFDQPKNIISPIKAGFPNPAGDALPMPLDLNQLVVPRPVSTYFMRVEGEAAYELGIVDGDIVVADRALTPKTGDIVVAVHENEFVIRQLKKQQNQAWLLAGSQNSPVALHENPDTLVWGVVTYVIHKTRKSG